MVPKPRLVPSSYESIRHFLKWLPKIIIQIFKEYLRAKLQAPVVTLTHFKRDKD